MFNKLIFILLISISSSVIHAATGSINARVIRSLANDGAAFGGCMILLDTSVNTVLPTCPGSWLSLSCTGDFNPKDHANRMYDNAMMAKALNRNIAVYFSDTEKHNGWCVANRIDVL